MSFKPDKSQCKVGPPLLLLLLVLLLLLSSTTTTISNTEEAPSVYDILPKYGLPRGLLPNTVTNYTFSTEDGSFSVSLPKPCYVNFDYLVYYEKHVTGKLSYGSITDLKGIQVKKLFLWLNVDEIKVDLPPSDSIYFQVGFINKRLDIDQFKSVHSCRDDALRLCDHPPRPLLLLPTPDDDIPILITE